MFSTRLFLQTAAYALFAGLLVLVATGPYYRPVPPDMAMVQVSFAHAGAPDGECRRLGPAELASRAPNMRAEIECPRARRPVTLRLELDGATLIDETVPAGGLARDGASSLFRRLRVAAGRHHLRITVHDGSDPAHSRDEWVELAPGRILNVDFKPERGGVIFL
jgi:hypothetical protein